MNENKIFLSVVIPAYNESNRIGKTLRQTLEYLKYQPYSSEVLVVDDGSKDTTCEVVRKFAHIYPNVKLLNGEPNHGKGYAVRRGMLAAKGTWRLFMDADGSVGIDQIDSFLTEGRNGHDVVIGSIAHPDATNVVEHAGWHRRALGSMSKFMVRSIAVPGIYDTQRGFKLFSEPAAEIVFPRQKIRRFGFDIELLVIARQHELSVKELPVVWDNPDGSTVRPSDYLRTFKELFEIMSNKLANAYV